MCCNCIREIYFCSGLFLLTPILFQAHPKRNSISTAQNLILSVIAPSFYIITAKLWFMPRRRHLYLTADFIFSLKILKKVVWKVTYGYEFRVLFYCKQLDDVIENRKRLLANCKDNLIIYYFVIDLLKFRDILSMETYVF